MEVFNLKDGIGSSVSGFTVTDSRIIQIRIVRDEKIGRLQQFGYGQLNLLLYVVSNIGTACTLFTGMVRLSQ